MPRLFLDVLIVVLLMLVSLAQPAEFQMAPAADGGLFQLLQVSTPTSTVRMGYPTAAVGTRSAGQGPVLTPCAPSRPGPNPVGLILPHSPSALADRTPGLSRTEALERVTLRPIPADTRRGLVRKGIRMRTFALALSLAVLATSMAEAAKAIRGRVRGGKGYVIVGTSVSGRGVSQTLGAAEKFALRFPGTSGRGATLQLLAPSGRYFGPVVLRQKGSTAFLALSGNPANLGQIVLHDGWAAAVRAVPKKAVDRSRTTNVGADGAPSGAGRLGVVATTAAALRASAAIGDDPHSPGADPDGDGIVNAYDADDDGDLILDNEDPDNSADRGGVFSTLFVTLNNSLNANVGTVTRSAIDASVHDNMNLIFFFDQRELEGKTIQSADVDCHTLSYCAPHVGTGELTGVSESSPDLPRGPWVNYDPTATGFRTSSRSHDPTAPSTSRASARSPRLPRSRLAMRSTSSSVRRPRWSACRGACLRTSSPRP